MLTAGADINAKSSWWAGGFGLLIYQWKLGSHLSPHRAARKFGHDDVYRLLMDQSPAEVRLLEACWLGDEATLQALGATHADLVRKLFPGDQRQVADAARNNETAVVRSMLKAGLPVDAHGQHRATPLHWAAFHGNHEMVKEILPFGPPLETTDADFNSTPLGWALHGSEHGWCAARETIRAPLKRCFRPARGYPTTSAEANRSAPSSAARE